MFGNDPQCRAPNSGRRKVWSIEGIKQPLHLRYYFKNISQKTYHVDFQLVFCERLSALFDINQVKQIVKQPVSFLYFHQTTFNRKRIHDNGINSACVCTKTIRIPVLRMSLNDWQGLVKNWTLLDVPCSAIEVKTCSYRSSKIVSTSNWKCKRQ